MTIKEVEEKLELPRATVRYYEKEGLIHPKRSGNSYREYSDEDVATLKKIIVLRKIGSSVSDIEDFLNEDMTLKALLDKNIAELEEKMKELEGAMRVCKIMQDRDGDGKNFDEEYYWEEIHAEEAAGNKFFELVNDVVTYEKNVILKEFDLINNEGEMIYGKKESILRALGLCLFLGFFSIFLDGMKWSAFRDGFFFPFICIIIYSIFGLPLHFLGKKHPKAAKVIKNIGIGFVMAFVVVLLLVVIFGEHV